MSVTSERLRELRLKKELSQADIANYLGISRTAYVKYESGQSKPVRKLKQLCALFNVTADYILGTDNQPTKPLEKPSFMAENYSDHEIALIKKYRALSDSAKGFVDTTIQAYYDKEQSEKESKRGNA